MSKHKKRGIQVGDPVKLKISRSSRPPRRVETPEELGIGTVVEKLTGLFLYPHEKNIIFEYDSELDPNYISYKSSKEKEVEQTSICKIYWFGIDKDKWEYEKDLEVLINSIKSIQMDFIEVSSNPFFLELLEKYPELKANQNFLDLQNQLEGTENRINVARNRFNESVNTYDIFTKKFPNSVLSGWFGFDEMTRYKANAGSENAPEIDFDFN